MSDFPFHKPLDPRLHKRRTSLTGRSEGVRRSSFSGEVDITSATFLNSRRRSLPPLDNYSVEKRLPKLSLTSSMIPPIYELHHDEVDSPKLKDMRETEQQEAASSPVSCPPLSSLAFKFPIKPSTPSPNQRAKSDPSLFDTLLSHSSPQTERRPQARPKIRVRNARPQQLPSDSGLCGLQNLGNTCFMNACLQCLSQTEPLRDYILSGQYRQEINSSNSLSMKGELIEAFASLVADLWANHSSAVSPARVKYVIGRWAPQFIGYNQQDCQEFLRFLLDGLHEDTNRVQNIPTVGSPQIQPLSPRSPTIINEPLSSASNLRNLVMQRPISEVCYEITRPQSVMQMANQAESSHSRRASLERSSRPEDENVLVHKLAQASWKNYKNRNDSFISDLFSGQLQSTLTCTVCGYRSYCFDPFLDLSIPIPSVAGDNGPVTLEDCLAKFTEEEHLAENEQTYCDRCEAPRICTKRLALYRLPKILVIHLKRFSYTENVRDKLSTQVTCNREAFDMSTYLTSTAALAFPTQSCIYDLYAVSNHTGGLGGGHYTAHCLNASNGVWYSFNDSIVVEDESSAVPSPDSYVLFLKRRKNRK
eukprot:GILK01011304.1.p1 GENE.GILK01011304.1~~GILK01011304.1.p1  ORF type:complete len:590 (-),score=84.15 GILK01011304.1:61-1830(-)